MNRQNSIHYKSRTVDDSPSTSITDAVAAAALAFMEGNAQNSVDFLESTLQFKDINKDQEYYIKTSLTYLKDLDAFDGLLGAHVVHIETDSKAAQAELRKGDAILRYNGVAVTEPGTLANLAALARNAPTVPVEPTGYADG
ncbi:MAG TPA: PDZ domain-containing protein [Candidatus Competibacteraceae bacterium]|nr:PDZ domain-containing protein [Candidatus Competibacteraceae bacterium]